jgi:hypothetical protein
LVADGDVKLLTLGLAFTLNDAVLLLDILLVQFELFFTAVIVNVVDPVVVSADDGIVNVPLPVPIANVAVLSVALLAPLRLYVTVYVPLTSVLELTVTVDDAFKQMLVADGDVKLLTSGFAFTLNEAVLLLDMLLVQFEAFLTAVIVTVVEPVAVSADDGIVNVPLPVPIARVAVLFVALLAPLRLYVTVYVPLLSVLELTVAVDGAPEQTLVADGDVKLLTFGAAFTLNEAVLLDDTLLEQVDEFCTALIVTVFVPAAANEPEGIKKVPVPDAIVTVAVVLDTVLAPDTVYVTVYVPLARELALTVTVEPEPRQGDVAVGDVKPETSGFALTLNEAVLLLDTLLVQLELFFTALIVNVLEPGLPSEPEAIANVPTPEAMVTVALVLDIVFAPDTV